MKLSEVNDLPKSGTDWELFKKMCALLRLKPDYQGGDFDGEEALTDAIKILKDWRQDPNNANNIAFTLANIRSNLKEETAVHHLRSDAVALSDAFQYTPQAWFKEGLDLSVALAQKAKAMRDHITAVIEIYETLRLAMTTFDPHKTIGSDEWRSHGKLVYVAFKKMGIL